MGQVSRRRRRRWPFVLLGVVVVIVGALAALDYAARVGTEHLIATDVKNSTHSESAQVSISSFPFLYHVVAEGRVDRIRVTDNGVPVGLLRLDQVRVDASRVYFARKELLQQHYVHLTKVGSATISVVTRLSTLESSLATDLGVQVAATSSDHVTIAVAGRVLASIDLTKIPIIPSCPLTVTHQGPTYTFSCTVSPVPQSVLAALSRLQQAPSS